MTFAETLRKARLGTIDPQTGKPLSQRRLAEMLEVHKNSVIGWEGKSGRLPDLGHRRALLRWFPGLFSGTT